MLEAQNMDVATERLRRARAHRDRLWSACQSWKEEARIGHLARFCTGLCGGDVIAGEALAREAIWS